MIQIRITDTEAAGWEERLELTPQAVANNPANLQTLIEKVVIHTQEHQKYRMSQPHDPLAAHGEGTDDAIMRIITNNWPT